MKPFNLEQALAGEPVVTRAGKPVTQLTKFDSNDSAMPLRGVTENKIQAWSSVGLYSSGESRYDLFMATKKRTVWVNIYPGCCGGPFDTQEQAETMGADKSQKLGGRAWPVEIEE